MPLHQTPLALLLSLPIAVALTACGGSSSSPEASSYTVGGELAGLGSGKSLVLHNNGGDELVRNANGSFEFASKLAPDKPYAVSVATQPSGQQCTVSNGAGTVSGTVSNIRVQCADVDTSSVTCLDNPQLRKEGNHYSVTTPQGTSQYYLQALTTYHGYAAVPMQITGLAAAGNLLRVNFTNVSDGMFLTYGSYDLPLPKIKANEIYYLPGRGFPVALDLNQAYTTQGQMVSLNNNAPDTVSTWRDSVTYLGRESVTTAFGTFETCKMRYTSVGDDGVLKTRDSWLVGAGKLAGLSVQETAATGTTQPTNITVSWD